MSAYQQGHADGLCGLYAVLNFLHRSGKWDEKEASSTLWYILDACRHLGWLDARNLTIGFEQYQLKAILDVLISNHRLPYRVLDLEDALAISREKSFYDLAKRVVKPGGFLVASDSRLDHWVLIACEKEGLTVVNSDDLENPTRPLKQDHCRYSPRWGIVIVPHERALPEVVL